jgi:hypothetical protein
MKRLAWTIIFLYSLNVLGQTRQLIKSTKYTLIKATKEIPGDINQLVIDKLDEPLKAIAAYYSALGGSNCTQDTSLEETCDLTTALGLGNQGSEKHKALIKKWFPNDKAARQLLAQDCYLRPSGASSFSDYVYLSLIRQGDTIIINYSLMLYRQGKITYLKGPDKVLIKGNQIKVLKRHIWEKI